MRLNCEIEATVLDLGKSWSWSMRCYLMVTRGNGGSNLFFLKISFVGNYVEFCWFCLFCCLVYWMMMVDGEMYGWEWKVKTLNRKIWPCCDVRLWVDTFNTSPFQSAKSGGPAEFGVACGKHSLLLVPFSWLECFKHHSLCAMGSWQGCDLIECPGPRSWMLFGFICPDAETETARAHTHMKKLLITFWMQDRNSRSPEPTVRSASIPKISQSQQRWCRLKEVNFGLFHLWAFNMTARPQPTFLSMGPLTLAYRWTFEFR